MQTQQAHILEALSEQGWRVIQREIGETGLIDEIWTVESVWRPLGERAYLAFIYDGQAPIQRAKGDNVWAVQISSRHPCQDGYRYLAQVPLRPGWERVHRVEFCDAIGKLRGLG
jgi:hypothetical protein